MKKSISFLLLILSLTNLVGHTSFAYEKSRQNNPYALNHMPHNHKKDIDMILKSKSLRSDYSSISSIDSSRKNKFDHSKWSKVNKSIKTGAKVGAILAATIGTILLANIYIDDSIWLDCFNQFNHTFRYSVFGDLFGLGYGPFQPGLIILTYTYIAGLGAVPGAAIGAISGYAHQMQIGWSKKNKVTDLDKDLSSEKEKS